MTFELCTSGAIVTAAGANVNTTAAASSAILTLCYNAGIGFINLATRYDWATNWGSASGSCVALSVSDAVASIAATSLLAYDLSGYKTVNEDLVNVLYDRAGRIIEYLKVYKKPEVNA